MEDKKKYLRELEARKNNTLEMLDSLHERLGASLFSSLEAKEEASAITGLSSEKDDSPSSLYEEKTRLVNEITDSEESIREIEADLHHLGEIEAIISRKEQEKNEKNREISHLCLDLGRLILSNPGFENFTSDFEQEMNELSLKIDFQQKKIEELDNSEGSFFTRLTNSVKSIVTKAQLTKSEAALDKFCRSVGERFLLHDAGLIDNDEIADLRERGKELREKQNVLNEEHAKLKTERRDTAEAIDRKGNPARRISEFEILIKKAREEINRVHRRFGSSICKSEWQDYFLKYFTETEHDLADKIAALEESINITDSQISTTKIEIAIDIEKAEIAKLKIMVKDKQQRITDAQDAIIKMEEQIADAEGRIIELSGKNNNTKTTEKSKNGKNSKAK